MKREVVLAFVVGFAVGALWMRKHLTCRPCQEKWQQLKRSLGLRMIE